MSREGLESFGLIQLLTGMRKFSEFTQAELHSMAIRYATAALAAGDDQYWLLWTIEKLLAFIKNQSDGTTQPQDNNKPLQGAMLSKEYIAFIKAIATAYKEQAKTAPTYEACSKAAREFLDTYYPDSTGTPGKPSVSAKENPKRAWIQRLDLKTLTEFKELMKKNI